MLAVVSAVVVVVVVVSVAVVVVETQPHCHEKTVLVGQVIVAVGPFELAATVAVADGHDVEIQVSEVERFD